MSPFSLILRASASFATVVGTNDTDLPFGTNSTISCNWTSPQALAGAVHAHNLSVPAIVAQCVGVCDLVFGNGNPDISGKGVMISYFFQAGLTSLFGPLLPVVIWLLKLRFDEDAIEKLTTLLRKLQASVYGVNAFFCISLLIAGVVRFQQVPSIMEVIFISILINTQVIVIMSMLSAQLYDYMLNQTTLGFSWNIYYYLISFSQIGVGYSVDVPSYIFPVYFKLANECHTQRQFINIAAYFAPTTNKSSTVKWWGIGLAIGLAAGVIARFLKPLYRWLKTMLLRIMPEWLKTHGVSILLILVLLLYVYDLIMASIKLNTIRNWIAKIGGAQFQDNQWGYGQTTAVLLWLPFFWDSLKQLIKHYIKLPSTENETETVLQPSLPWTAMPQAPPPPYSVQNAAPMPRPSMDNSSPPILHNYTHVDDSDEPVFEIQYQDTESLADRHGTIAQTPTASQAMSQEPVPPRSFEGSMQRTTTGLEANLQDPGSEGLRRRFT